MFRVIWMEEAVDSLLEAFDRVESSQQQSIENSVVRLDALLEYDAHNFGESREGNQRIGIDGMCGIRSVVDDPDENTVRIIHFWTIASHP